MKISQKGRIEDTAGRAGMESDQKGWDSYCTKRWYGDWPEGRR